jgi:hypothetical protein
MRSTRSAIAIVLPLALACARSSSLPEPPSVARSAGLTAAASCDELKSRIAGVASQQMRMTIESYRDGGWAWGGGIARGGGTGPQAGPPVPMSSGPVATTGTNDQVAGVDEGDFMKSDGTRLLVLSGRTLFLARSWPPQDLALASSLEIEGWPTELHLDDGGRAVVLSMVPDAWTPKDAPDPLGRIGIGACRADWGCFFGPGTTKLTVIDATDIASPKVLDEQYLPGRVRASRRIGGSIRVVLSDDVRWPSGVRLWPDWSASQDKDQWSKLLDALEAENERIIRSAPLESWLPRGKRKLRDGSTVDVAHACGDFYLSSAPVRLGLVTVATLDLSGGAAAGRTSILGEASQVYSSAQTLYVAEDHWWWWPKPGQRDVTYLHAFDLSDAGRARYTASGAVEGHPINQFALDEFNGDLRVAALIARRVEEPQNRWGRLELSNQVSVLRREGDQLVVLGKTAELAPGESLRSARFAGDRGYLVTFRNIDPLFSLDLSDPKAPRVAGDLKVPGFATYLHPIDADHLLALGIDLPEPDANGRVDFSQRKMKLSLFDVAQLAAPKLKFTQLVGTANGWSEAAYEHRAFNWFGRQKLLAIPFSDWVATPTADPWRQFVSDLKVYRVDVGSGFAPLGSIDLKDLFARSGAPRFDEWYSAWVRRSVMSTDDVGTEYVYAVSDAGLRVATAAALSKPMASVAFPPPPPLLLP